MNLTQREDESGHVISNAMHGVADSLEVPERVKQKIDEQIASRREGCCLYNESMEINLATLCLDLFESMEGKVGRNIAHIKCVPSDDAFDREIVFKDYMFQTMEVLLLDLFSKFAVINQEVMLATKGSNITISGLNNILDYLEELYCERDDKAEIERSENALALAYLKLNGCYIREVMEEGRNVILIGFGSE